MSTIAEFTQEKLNKYSEFTDNEKTYYLKNWMNIMLNLKTGVLLEDIYIPGSCNSISYKSIKGNEFPLIEDIFKSIHKKQSYDILEQFNSGIRIFNIYVVNRRNEIYLYDGFNIFETYDNFHNTLTDIINNESVILNIDLRYTNIGDINNSSFNKSNTINYQANKAIETKKIYLNIVKSGGEIVDENDSIKIHTFDNIYSFTPSYTDDYIKICMDETDTENLRKKMSFVATSKLANEIISILFFLSTLITSTLIISSVLFFKYINMKIYGEKNDTNVSIIRNILGFLFVTLLYVFLILLFFSLLTCKIFGNERRIIHAIIKRQCKKYREQIVNEETPVLKITKQVSYPYVDKEINFTISLLNFIV